MASGLAVVATDVGNHREMYESQLNNFGESGMLLVDRSVDSIAAALTQLKKDPARIAAMGAINREEIATRWSWTAWHQAYSKFLRMGM